MDRRVDVVAAVVGLLLILLALPKACAFENEVRVRNMALELCVIPYCPKTRSGPCYPPASLGLG